MALPGSGNPLSFSQINVELGNGSTSLASMATMTNAAIGNSGITATPDAVSEWYGYSHASYGVIYGEDDWTGPTGGARLYANGTYYIMNSVVTAEATATSSPQSTYCRKANGTTFSALTDSCSGSIRRRLKGTSNTFLTQQAWNAKTGFYSSQSYSCDFNTYDWLWKLL